MKSKDYTTIAIIAIVSGFLSVLISGFVIPADTNRGQEVEVVQPITSEFIRPPQAYFNDQSVNPTQLIQIGPSADNQPFGTE